MVSRISQAAGVGHWTLTTSEVAAATGGGFDTRPSTFLELLLWVLLFGGLAVMQGILQSIRK